MRARTTHARAVSKRRARATDVVCPLGVSGHRARRRSERRADPTRSQRQRRITSGAQVRKAKLNEPPYYLRRRNKRGKKTRNPFSAVRQPRKCPHSSVGTAAGGAVHGTDARTSESRESAHNQHHAGPLSLLQLKGGSRTQVRRGRERERDSSVAPCCRGKAGEV